MPAEDITLRWERHYRHWLTIDGDVIHPDAPAGSGGPGHFRLGGPLQASCEFCDPVPHPSSPSARYLAQNTRKHPASPATKSDAAAGSTAPLAPAVPRVDLNKSLLEGAKAQVGKPRTVVQQHVKVTKSGRKFHRNQGDGQCTELPEKLLEDLGGYDSDSFTPANPKETDESKKDYVWGDKVSPEDSKPGDIVQFKNYRFKTI